MIEGDDSGGQGQHEQRMHQAGHSVGEPSRHAWKYSVADVEVQKRERRARDQGCRTVITPGPAAP